MAQIVCKDLAIGYDGNVVAQGINFSVNRGDYVCIIGENGAGKSTLMKTILHLLKPLDGTVCYGDHLCSTEIGYLPQQTMVQRDFPASVKEIILSGCLNHMERRIFYGKKEKKCVKHWMEKLEITDLSNRCFRELSGGQQQRVLLARALCAAGKILLLDEPVSGLDPKAALEMYQLLKRINREEKITILMISHDVKAVIPFASHILYMGKKFVYETKDNYLKIQEKEAL